MQVLGQSERNEVTYKNTSFKAKWFLPPPSPFKEDYGNNIKNKKNKCTKKLHVY
jgi:hypothetical protein